MTPTFLAMIWRSADGTPTVAFWLVAVETTLMIAIGIWSLAAPESLRFHYFNLLNLLNYRRRSRGLPLLTSRDAFGWSSGRLIRFWGVVVIALAAGFMTWVVFFTAPGVAY